MNEMVCSANQAWFEYPGLCEGAINTLEKFGNEEQRDAYLPPLISGEWLGTMCLTEPHCGTDLGLLKTRAQPVDDGEYELSGTKIFITSGEHDFTDNIVHIVLARLPGAPEGSRGISLFAAPKILLDGTRNFVNCGSIEHKMGIRGSATTVLNFDRARGSMIGKPNEGLKCMFTFMNYARVGAASQGICAAERSFQGALAYAKERLAMRSLSGPKAPDKPADPIIVHPDVRRMLLIQKAIAEGGRAFLYYLHKQVDLARHAPVENEREAAENLLSLLTPIAKALLTELGYEAANYGVQVFGGHGYIVENGMEQIVRDAKICTIWEGTTGVQALDLLGRKIAGSGGELLRNFTSIVSEFCDANSDQADMKSFIDVLVTLLDEWHETTAEICERAATNREEIGAASVDYLMYSGYITMAFFWALMARTALDKLGTSDAEKSFYEAKLKTARFYFDRMLPRTESHKRAMLSGPDNLMDLDEAHFTF
jgi:alkylation response protein AidB-like acyl-CoA dehydrogenase